MCVSQGGLLGRGGAQCTRGGWAKWQCSSRAGIGKHQGAGKPATLHLLPRPWQYLMEGSYNKVFLAKGNIPAESYTFFIDILLDTIRYVAPGPRLPVLVRSLDATLPDSCDLTPWCFS